MTSDGRSYPRYAPWWSPWGAAARLGRVIRAWSDVGWLVRIGWFIARLPGDVERTHLTRFLEHIASAPRPRAADPQAAAERIIRLRAPWLSLPGLRGRNTCYVRALTLYRFLDAGAHEARLRFAAEWFDHPGGVLRGHAWVTVNDTVLEAPPNVDDHARLQPIELFPRR